ncbi:hypothetical protein EDC01DRAFT_659675 [Geopyxis carbonaria]|nr:hypothetical protein EDC01DRAFT_659675 [Geopyxis carbonaria]
MSNGIMSTSDSDLEKNMSTHHDHEGHGDALKTLRTAGSVSMSPELFEKLYLSPENKVKGDLRKTFGNPTPLALAGFLLTLTPLSCALMGWRGAGGSGAAFIGNFFFMGGLLMVLGGFLEFILGNTFPFVVFTSFGGFWLTFGGTLSPSFGSYAAYATTSDPASGLENPMFYNTYGFFFIFMGLLCLIYLICSLRTNVVFATIFFTLVIAFGLLAGAYFQIGQGNAELGATLQKAAGAVTFVTDAAGWYIFIAVMLPSVDFPFSLPVGDLSRVVRGASDRAKSA